MSKARETFAAVNNPFWRWNPIHKEFVGCPTMVFLRNTVKPVICPGEILTSLNNILILSLRFFLAQSFDA
jgi:hypothetical protein